MTLKAKEPAPGRADAIIELYTRLAQQPEQDFGWNKGKENARALGYDEGWLERLPDIVWESAAGVGNPFSLGGMRSGDVVVDIGCGCGADACIAALLVGEKGRVIGIDITPAMIAKARAGSRLAGITNASFLVGSMENLPFPDSLADVVISNGSINLSPHKPCVFKEIHRVLAPRGRLLFADMVREGPAEGHCGSWADCVSGAVEPETYLKMLVAAGFEDAELVAFSGYKTAPITIGASFRARKKARSTRHARGPSRPGSVLDPSLLWIGAVALGYRIGPLFEKPAAFHYRPFSTPR